MLMELRCCMCREDDALSSADLTYTYGNDHSYNMTVNIGMVRAPHCRISCMHRCQLPHSMPQAMPLTITADIHYN
jgi:hypothetical protein